MKNFVKILIITALLASATVFTSCATNEPMFDVEGRVGGSAQVIEAPDGATGRVKLAHLGARSYPEGEPVLFYAYAELGNVFASQNHHWSIVNPERGTQRVRRASGLDLTAGRYVTVYINVDAPRLDPAKTVTISDTIIIIH